jgi:hypothetical protein
MTYYRVDGQDGITHERKRVPSVVGTLRPDANLKSENEAGEHEAHVGILEDRVGYFDLLSTDDGRVLESIGQNNERDEGVALNHTQTKQSEDSDVDL